CIFERRDPHAPPHTRGIFRLSRASSWAGIGDCRTYQQPDARSPARARWDWPRFRLSCPPRRSVSCHGSLFSIGLDLAFARSRFAVRQGVHATGGTFSRGDSAHFLDRRLLRSPSRNTLERLGVVSNLQNQSRGAKWTKDICGLIYHL